MTRLPSDQDSQIELNGLKVLIAGPQRFQNDLISFYLTQEVAIKCLTEDTFDFDNWSTLTPDERPQVVLVDVKMEGVVSSIENWNLQDGGADKPIIILFNADNGYDLHHALWAGVRGVFFSNEPLEIFANGLRSICNGELWFPRKIIANFLRTIKDDVSAVSLKENYKLTEREEEILALLASGEDNKGISEKLFISYHTVKTHLYKIYKKLGATNRVQAALWARRHLRQSN